MPKKPPAPGPLPTATTLDEVIDAIASIIEWSVDASSRLGYFAALYKRITIAVDAAIKAGAFQDGQRMERFDVAFANRYLAAVNGYFHPDQFPGPTHSWHVSFEAAVRPEPILLQHMLGGVNAHIDLDLAIAAEMISPGTQLPSLQGDFNTINAVLAGQVNSVVEEINELSPVLADVYAALMKNEINLINQGVKLYRDSAWSFAHILAAEPSVLHAGTIWARDLKVAAQGALIYHPAEPISSILEAIAAHESRDVVKNIEVLDRIASTPAPITTVI